MICDTDGSSYLALINFSGSKIREEFQQNSRWKSKCFEPMFDAQLANVCSMTLSHRTYILWHHQASRAKLQQALESSQDTSDFKISPTNLFQTDQSESWILTNDFLATI